MEMLRDGGGNNSIEIKRQKRSGSSEGQLSGDEAEVQERAWFNSTIPMKL